MSRKDVLNKKLTRLLAKKEELKKRALASDSVEEVRSLNETVEELGVEIEEVREEISAIELEERNAAGQTVSVSDPVPANAAPVNGTVVASYTGEGRSEENPLGSKEYRMAFMNYVRRGTPIPEKYALKNLGAEYRQAAIDTKDGGAAIPFTVLDRIVNTNRKRYGNLYSRVRKLSVRGGLRIPVGSLQATAHWITEKTVSPKQDLGELGAVTFGYNVLECRVAQTYLSDVLESFETQIAEQIYIAYAKAMDEAIVKGSGDGAPLGIINDPRVTNVVEMSAQDFSDWSRWDTKFFANLALGYTGGNFIMTRSTIYKYLKTMKDDNNRPIYYESTGLVIEDNNTLDPRAYFMGREINIVEPDIIPDFDTASDGDVVAIFWQPEEYGVNENAGFTMRRYFDEDTNEWISKMLAVTDGKVINPNGFVLIKKDA